MDDAEVCKIIFQSDSFLAFHISFSIEFNIDLMDKGDVECCHCAATATLSIIL